MNKWSVVLNDKLSAPMNPPMRLEHTHAYTVVLISGELTYSWYNISAALGNNTFAYSFDGVDYTTITIPDGVWSSCTLKKYIEDIVNAAEPPSVSLSSPPVVNIIIEEQYYNGVWCITMNNDMYFDTALVGTIIGFNNGQIIQPSSTCGSSSTKFTDRVKAINISCNLVDNTRNHHNKGNSNILFSSATPLVQPWDRIQLVKTMPWSVQAAQTSMINNVSINILDQDLRVIALNDPTTSFWLEITDMGKIPQASHKVSST